MTAQRPGKDGKKLKASAHVCSQCGFSINLKDLGVRGGATGLVTCPNCNWSGPVNIQIVDGSRASANRAAMCEVAA
jgi:predicted RNA-binding Zn-ribbon protein involved in translation (DUF1610 family)